MTSDEWKKRDEMRVARINALTEAIDVGHGLTAFSRFIVCAVFVGQAVAGWRVALTGSRFARMAAVSLVVWLLVARLCGWIRKGLAEKIDRECPAPQPLDWKKDAGL